MSSSKFFFKRPTASILPYLGCLMTLAAIALDPFTQQILRFDTRLAEAGGSRYELRYSHIYDLRDAGNPSMDRGAFRKSYESPTSSSTAELNDAA